jgi:hypothetical protein
MFSTTGSPNDVLVGARGTHPSGPGNDRFNKIVDSYIPRYNMTTSKNEKGKVFLEIYQTVRCFGRFLCNDPKTGLFYEISEPHAKEKISHALRYRRKRIITGRNRTKSDPKTGGTATTTAGTTTTSLGELLAAERRARSLADVSQVNHQPERPNQLPCLSLVSRPPHPELFSDEELALVLGQPCEIDWTAILSSSLPPKKT